MAPDRRGCGREWERSNRRPSQGPYCAASSFSGGGGGGGGVSRMKVFNVDFVPLDFAAVEPSEAELDLPGPK